MLYLEDIKIGDQFKSREYEMTLEEIKEFAGKYDPQVFHLALAHGDGHEVLSQRLDLLAARQSGFDFAVPDQVGHLIAKHRHPLVGRPSQLAIGHFWFLP